MKNKILKSAGQWLIYLLLFMLIAFGVNLYKSRQAVSGVAPVLQAKDLNGKIHDLQQLPKPALVHFWASWCPICKLEEGSLDSLADSVPLITIAMQSGSDQEVQDFMQERQLSFPVINDDSGVIANSWGVKGVPTSFIINQQGEIEFVEVGYTSEIGLRLRLWYAGL